jgi:hypothetical protein
MMEDFTMFDKNGRRIWDGDYVTNPIASGVVTGKNRAAVLVRVMDDFGHEEWVIPNQCEIIDNPDSMEAPEFPNGEFPGSRTYYEGYNWDNEITTWSGRHADGTTEW